MKQPTEPKISISSLILTVTIIAGIIIYAASKLIKEKHSTTLNSLVENHVNRQSEDTATAGDLAYKSAGVQTKPLPDINDPITTKKDSLLPDRYVKHPAYSFKEEELNTIMMKICLRYQIDYGATEHIPYLFTGTIPENASLNEALDTLRKITGLQFERTHYNAIIVNRKK